MPNMIFLRFTKFDGVFLTTKRNTRVKYFDFCTLTVSHMSKRSEHFMFSGELAELAVTFADVDGLY